MLKGAERAGVSRIEIAKDTGKRKGQTSKSGETIVTGLT